MTNDLGPIAKAGDSLDELFKRLPKKTAQGGALTSFFVAALRWPPSSLHGQQLEAYSWIMLVAIAASVFFTLRNFSREK